jgi:hypothetical protein
MEEKKQNKTESGLDASIKQVKIKKSPITVIGDEAQKPLQVAFAEGADLHNSRFTGDDKQQSSYAGVSKGSEPHPISNAKAAQAHSKAPQNAGRPALGKYLEYCFPDDEQKWLNPARELDIVRKNTARDGQRFCLAFSSSDEVATLQRGTSLKGNKARITGVLPCNLQTCPNCAKRSRFRKAVEVQGICENLLSSKRDFCGVKVDRELFMITLTASHHKNESLSTVLERVQGSAKKLFAGRMGMKWRNLGLEVVSRSVEVTYGKNSWHPHLHLLVSFSALPLGEYVLPEWQKQDLWKKLRDSWVTLTEGKARADVGFDVVPVDRHSLAEVAGYVSGVSVSEQAKGAAMEAVRHDLKRGRKGNIGAFEVPSLMVKAEAGEDVEIGGKLYSFEELVSLWQEWEIALTGVHQVAIGRGMSAFRMTKEEVDDRVEEIAQAQEKDDEVTTWETVRELSPFELKMARIYGMAPLLKVTAERGEIGAIEKLNSYKMRWKHRKRQNQEILTC